jgi:hypothetical protein
MHTSLQSIGAHSSAVSVPRATRGAEGKHSFQPAFEEASTKATEAESTNRAPAHDAQFSYKETPAKSEDDEAAAKEHASDSDPSPKRTATPVLIRPVEYDAVKPASAVNKKNAGSTETPPVVANPDPSPSLLKPPILRAIEFRAAPWAATEAVTETVPASEDEPARPPPPAKPTEVSLDDTSEEVSHSGSPGALVFQLSFQVPAAEAAAPEEVAEPTHFEVGEIKAEAIPEAMPVSADFTHHPLPAADIEMPPAQLPPSRTEQAARPAVSLPEEPEQAATGSPVQKMGLTIRGADDQVVRLQISQSNGSVRVEAHAEDASLARHLSTSLPELVDRLDRQGYAPAVTSTPTSHRDVDARDGGGSGGEQQPKKQRERSKNAWRALASQLHDS